MMEEPAVTADGCCCNKIIYLPINAFIEYGLTIDDFVDPITGGFYVLTDTGDDNGNIISMMIWNGEEFVVLANANIASMDDIKVRITTNYAELDIFHGDNQKMLNDKIVEKVLEFGDTYVTILEFQDFAFDTDNRLDILESMLLEGMKTPKPFDASQFLNFPNQPAGFTYKVIVAGTVSGVKLEIGDMIIYSETGDNPYVVQTNIDKATPTVRGIVRLATQEEVNAGMDYESVIVPSTLQTKLNNLIADQSEVNSGVNGVKYVTPLTLKTLIAPLLANSHSHTNKPILDQLGDSNNNLTYRGKTIIDTNNLVQYVQSDKTYVHEQNIPSKVWAWFHGLGKVVSVTIQNSAGTRIRGEEFINDGVKVEYHFNKEITGKGICN